MRRLLKGGRVVDPAQGMDGSFDVLRKEGAEERLINLHHGEPITFGADAEYFVVKSGYGLEVAAETSSLGTPPWDRMELKAGAALVGSAFAPERVFTHAERGRLAWL